MLELYVFQKLFERNLVKYSSKFNICYFLTAAATSKALIRRKTNREKSEISFQPIRGIFLRSKTFNWNWIHPDIVSWTQIDFLGSRVQRRSPINKKSLLIVIFSKKISETSQPYRIENLENQGKLKGSVEEPYFKKKPLETETKKA